MATESVRIDDRVLEEALQRKPHYLSTTAFLSQIIDSSNKKEFASLTLPPLQSPHHHPTINEERFERDREGLNESEANVHKGRERERKENKSKPYNFVVPDFLDWCQGDLTTYWKEAKSGKKTQYAAKLLFLEVEKIASNYSQSIALEQIALATANGWESITLKNYERFGLPPNVPKQAKEPEPKHPAYKVFKAPETGPTVNPVMKSLLNG
tara:strand:+ start:1075 stop:1707 length:633 start_codon:yes stop_codon:yes gene_type:complete